MFKSELLSLFVNVKLMLTEGGWVTVDGIDGTYLKRSLSEWSTLPKSGGVYVVFSRITNEFFIGNAGNFRARINNLLVTIKNGRSGNPEWVRLFKTANDDLTQFDVVCLLVNDNTKIGEIQGKLMAEFRNRGLLINKYYAPKIKGVSSNKEFGIYSCYMLKNKSTGEFYVGSCKDPRKRKSQHFKEMKDCKHHNCKVQASWDLNPNIDNWEWTTYIHRNKLAARNHERLLLEQNVGINQLCLNISSSDVNHVNSVATPETLRHRKTNAAAALVAKLGHAVIVDGKEYPSIGLAAVALGVNQSTVSRWVANPDNPRAVYVNPEEAAARGAQLKNLHAGALRKLTEDHHGAKKILVGDRVFDTMLEASRVLGVCEKSLRRQARDPLNSQVRWVQ
jgi:hypothetical protein